MYAFDVHCNSYFPLFLLLYGERQSLSHQQDAGMSKPPASIIRELCSGRIA